MTKKFHKFLISEELIKKYKLICIELDISMTKQTEKIIDEFIRIQRDNIKVQRKLKRMGVNS